MKLVTAKQISFDATLLVHEFESIEGPNFVRVKYLLDDIAMHVRAMQDSLHNEGVTVDDGL